jgi:hypothetical protein
MIEIQDDPRSTDTTPAASPSETDLAKDKSITPVSPTATVPAPISSSQIVGISDAFATELADSPVTMPTEPDAHDVDMPGNGNDVVVATPAKADQAL